MAPRLAAGRGACCFRLACTAVFISAPPGCLLHHRVPLNSSFARALPPPPSRAHAPHPHTVVAPADLPPRLPQLPEPPLQQLVLRPVWRQAGEQHLPDRPCGCAPSRSLARAAAQLLAPCVPLIFRLAAEHYRYGLPDSSALAPHTNEPHRLHLLPAAVCCLPDGRARSYRAPPLLCRALPRHRCALPILQALPTRKRGVSRKLASALEQLSPLSPLQQLLLYARLTPRMHPHSDTHRFGSRASW